MRLKRSECVFKLELQKTAGPAAVYDITGLISRTVVVRAQCSKHEAMIFTLEEFSSRTERHKKMTMSRLSRPVNQTDSLHLFSSRRHVYPRLQRRRSRRSRHTAGLTLSEGFESSSRCFPGTRENSERNYVLFVPGARCDVMRCGEMLSRRLIGLAR